VYWLKSATAKSKSNAFSFMFSQFADVHVFWDTYDNTTVQIILQTNADFRWQTVGHYQHLPNADLKDRKMEKWQDYNNSVKTLDIDTATLFKMTGQWKSVIEVIRKIESVVTKLSKSFKAAQQKWLVSH